MSGWWWTVGAVRTLAGAWRDRLWWRKRRARLNRDGVLVIDGLLNAEMRRDLMAGWVSRKEVLAQDADSDLRHLRFGQPVSTIPPTVRPYLVFQPTDLAAMRAVEGWRPWP